MSVGKMFQLSSYTRGASKSNADQYSKNPHDSYFTRRKNAYDVLVKISRWTIFCYHLRSILIGMWILLKWLCQFLWHSIQQSTKHQQQIALSPGDFRGYFHDKPPPCLVDNRIGLQSYVKLKGTKLHYIEAGNRSDPLILLLHGFPDCWLGWGNQVTVNRIRIKWTTQRQFASFNIDGFFLFVFQIKELSRFFRVVALDLKGFNDSDKPQWRKEYTPYKICDELLQFIKSLGSNSVSIIGHDIGAVIGWVYTTRHFDYILFKSVALLPPFRLRLHFHSGKHLLLLCDD